jgi:RsmE family RNA methyltransferase
MELYYTTKISDGLCTLEGDEASHCMRVMRNKVGDRISVIDGSGTLYDCRIDAAPGSRVECSILASQEGYGKHPYSLTMAVALTKNMERYEWFAEKATELGIDRLVPLVGDFSIRKSFNRDRLERIIIGAAKQSLKAYIPRLDDATTVADFITSCTSPSTEKEAASSVSPATEGTASSSTHSAAEGTAASATHSAAASVARPDSTHTGPCVSPSVESSDIQPIKLICYCGTSYPKTFVTDALKAAFESRSAIDSSSQGASNSSGIQHDAAIAAGPDITAESGIAANPDITAESGISDEKRGKTPEIVILIGPEGDFSQAETEAAIAAGFRCVTLGDARLRVETAALLAVSAVNLYRR